MESRWMVRGVLALPLFLMIHKSWNKPRNNLEKDSLKRGLIKLYLRHSQVRWAFPS
jgi:hypothetical protein